MENDKLSLLETVAASFNKTYSDEVYTLWLDILSDRSYEDLKAGIKELLKEARFMPTIAEIRAAAIQHYVLPTAKQSTMSREEMDDFLQRADE